MALVEVVNLLGIKSELEMIKKKELFFLNFEIIKYLNTLRFNTLFE